MAIVIPSKHIYSKTFDPVIDNNVAKVEIGVKTPSVITQNDTVAEKTVEDFKDGSPNIIQKFNGYAAGDELNATYIRVEEIKYIQDVTISISKYQENNKLVKSLITGVDGNGNSNISYELFGDMQRGQIYVEMGVTGSGTSLSIVNSTINTYPTTDIQDTTYSFSISNDYKYKSSMTYLSDYLTVSPKETDLSTEVELDGGTLFSAAATETSDSWEISFNLLVGFTLCKAPLKAVEKSNGTYRVITLNPPQTYGTEYYPYFEKYIAKKVNITINGIVSTLNLEDSTVKIGDGNKTYSFDGNELIQTTNTPTIESKYQEIIDHWQNGKQTAVISCPIADYYDESGDKVIDISTSDKMLFEIGDTVIPYVYTNNGDKPLSYNKDLTPKQFKVVGVSVSKEQGVMQELTLQEV